MKRASRGESGIGKVFALGVGAWCAWALFVLGFWATVIYVAFHFISKYW